MLLYVLKLAAHSQNAIQICKIKIILQRRVAHNCSDKNNSSLVIAKSQLQSLMLIGEKTVYKGRGKLLCFIESDQLMEIFSSDL